MAMGTESGMPCHEGSTKGPYSRKILNSPVSIAKCSSKSKDDLKFYKHKPRCYYLFPRESHVDKRCNHIFRGVDRQLTSSSLFGYKGAEVFTEAGTGAAGAGAGAAAGAAAGAGAAGAAAGLAAPALAFL